MQVEVGEAFQVGVVEASEEAEALEGHIVGDVLQLRTKVLSIFVWSHEPSCVFDRVALSR